MTTKKAIDIFNRFRALQNKSVYVMEGAIEENILGNGINVKADLITSPAMKEILEEFEHVTVNEKGLNIFA